MQNFSSRNSLRTARFVATSSNIPDRDKTNLFSKPLITPRMTDEPNDRMLVKGVDRNENYVLINDKNTECFLRVENEALVCMLCGVREKFHSEYTIEKHLKTDRHNIQFLELRDDLLWHLPHKFSMQMNAVAELLIHWYESQSLKPDEITSREIIVEEFYHILSIIDPQCQLRLIGSLLTGTSIKKSDINLELVHPNHKLFESDPRSKYSIHHKLIDPDAEYGNQINMHTLHYDMIPNSVNTLYKMMTLIESDQGLLPFSVISNLMDLNRKVPKLVLNHRDTDTKLEVTCYTDSNHKLSVLLRSYMSLDARACTLGVLVKYWAHLCNIDNPEYGSLPPEAFLILVVYFLQRLSPPILPCLHEIITPKQKSNGSNNVDDPNDLQFGRLNLNSHETSLQLQDDQSDNDESESVDLQNEDFEDENNEPYIDSEFLRAHNIDWVSKSTKPVHELFIEFLRMMMYEFKDHRYAISIRSLNQVTTSSRAWSTHVKAIENPVRPKNNISRAIATVRAYAYIQTCFKNSFYYLTSLPLDSKGKMRREKQVDPAEYIEIYLHLMRQENYFDMRKGSIDIKTKYDPIREMIKQNLFARDVNVTNFLFNQSDHLTLPTKLVNFYNTTFLIPSDTASVKFCWSCRKFGHARGSCPSMKLENLLSEWGNYDNNLDIDANFDSNLQKFYEQNLITPELALKHDNIVRQLNDTIKEETGLDCLLQLFGSTVNDLGSRDSDLDICLTINNNPTGKGIDCVEILKQVQEALIKDEFTCNIEAILSARVPILKFRYMDCDVDLSMYNLCALYNSKLLKAYAQIDPRVPQLFSLVKKYAKACGIADASRGSLSSYAWSLMVVHYLQHTSPPILPVLQETSGNSRESVIGVNGWNVWFDESYDPSIASPNNLSITQLLKGFFLYFGTFNFALHVVSIRKFNLFTRYQKNWHNCMMAIEDPFELTYNLASRLDDSMATYIINSFAQAFRHFLRIQRNYIVFGQDNMMDFDLNSEIFNGRNITGSSPPIRGCRICGKIGHKLKECPWKTAKKGRIGTRKNKVNSRTK